MIPPQCGIDAYLRYLKTRDWSKGRPDLPSSHDVLIQEWKTKKFRQVFLTLSVYLNVAYKQRLVEMRRNGKRSSNGSQKHDGSIAKIDLIPDELKSCDSVAVYIAVIMYVLPNAKDSFKRELIFSIFNHKLSFENLQALLDAFKPDLKELKERLDSVKHDLHYREDYTNALVRTLLSTSDVLRDRSYSKFAMFLDGDVYVKMLQKHTAGFNECATGQQYDHYSTVAPYDPLFSRYVATCVASKDQNDTRRKLYKQFSVNKYDVLSRILEDLPPFVKDNSRLVNGASNTKDVQSFDNDTTYHVYENKIDFMKHIGYAERVINGKRFILMTYNDCVFDVLGDETFGKTWAERLELVGGMAKIRVDRRTGFELNHSKNSNCVLGVSWLDDKGRIHFRKYTPKREISSSVQHQANGSGGVGGIVVNDDYTNHHETVEAHYEPTDAEDELDTLRPTSIRRS